MGLYKSHKGAVTNLHFDFNGDGLIFQLDGRKRVFLFPPQSHEHFGMVRRRSTYFGGDLDDVGTVKTYLQGPHRDQWKKVEGFMKVVDLEPGDVLAIPMFWWHAVKSLSNCSSLILRLNTLSLDPDEIGKIPFADKMSKREERVQVQAQAMMAQAMFKATQGNIMPGLEAMLGGMGDLDSDEEVPESEDVDASVLMSILVKGIGKGGRSEIIRSRGGYQGGGNGEVGGMMAGHRWLEPLPLPDEVDWEAYDRWKSHLEGNSIETFDRIGLDCLLELLVHCSGSETSSTT